jgi:2-polyprenyl-3-methyl-5-hydroxy-6-metoxy-1,4-benzoquinol methylase
MSPAIGASFGSFAPGAVATSAGRASFVAKERPSLPAPWPGQLSRLGRLENIEGVYRAHHEARRAKDFVFCEPERSTLFPEWVGSGGRVLDVGCRYGSLTRTYVSDNEVVGVDVDREALEQAAALGIEPVWADAAEELPFEDESFDVVVLGELLEHLPMPERTVFEARRVLRKGGRLVGSVPNAYRLKSRLRFLLGGAPDPDPTHLHLFAPGELRALLADFDQVQLRFVAGRLTALHPRLFANDICFRARKPLR